MAKYLKKFENHTQYENYINGSGAILPNVSICTTEGDVHYNPYADPCQQHDYVEIGGVKWATKNVGACSETDYGLHFQWGDTQGYTADQVGSGEGQKYFGNGDYKYYNGYSTSIIKYSKSDGLTTLQASDDAVTAAWGGNWRMPTSAECVAFGNTVSTAWTDNYNDSGVAGMICTDKEDSSKILFFPACGVFTNGNVNRVGFSVACWSSTISVSTSGFYTNAFQLTCSSNTNVNWKNVGSRSNAIAVRGVLDA